MRGKGALGSGARRRRRAADGGRALRRDGLPAAAVLRGRERSRRGRGRRGGSGGGFGRMVLARRGGATPLRLTSAVASRGRAPATTPPAPRTEGTCGKGGERGGHRGGRGDGDPSRRRAERTRAAGAFRR